MSMDLDREWLFVLCFSRYYTEEMVIKEMTVFLFL